MAMRFERYGGGPFFSYENAESTFVDAEKMNLAIVTWGVISCSERVKGACRSKVLQRMVN